MTTEEEMLEETMRPIKRERSTRSCITTYLYISYHAYTIRQKRVMYN
jgi:hypothetical protein